MAFLPSYEEAVSGGNWLDLVAPYVALHCYSKLCRVSRRYYDHFTPRLWNDPVQTARLLGLHPNDDLKWLDYFVTKHAKTVRNSTRGLVTSLDFRNFVADATALAVGTSGHGFSELLQLATALFPSIRCILLNGNAGYDPADFTRLLKLETFPEDGSASMPLILDISHCGQPLPNNFFHPSYWRQLVYLDMSDLPGSLNGIVKTGTFRQGALPNLRILKLQGRQLDEKSFGPIADFSTNRIWSLDLSRNRLSDTCISTLLPQCFGEADLTVSGAHFEVEGKLSTVENKLGTEVSPVWRGRLSYVEESVLSSTFSHPDRHLADSPSYDAGSQSRLAGHEPLRRDDAEAVKMALAGGPGRVIPDWHGLGDLDICKPPTSLTHMYLTGNKEFTAEGIELIFRCSRGYIRHFDCASPAIRTDDGIPFQLFGILGRSHIFRPVFASNLQSIRIHHSLVTHIPTLIMKDASESSLVALEYAETVLRERAELAYPQVFVPDMNPRVQSLTLTCLPRVSTGPLIDKLIRFLISSYEQETSIRQATVAVSHRGPTVLRGLRHIRLEFEPHPPTDDLSDATFDSLDAQALLNSGADDFSFFGEAAAPLSRPSIKPGSNAPNDTDVAQKRAIHPNPSEASPASFQRSTMTGNGAATRQSDRLPHYPLPGAIDSDSEYVRETISVDDKGRTHRQAISVWVGPGRRGPSQAINAYMKNLAKPSLRTRIQPASPDQVKTGVPIGVCVYNHAWDAIIWSDGADGSTSVETREGGGDRDGMRDVVDAIRQFRTKTKAGYIRTCSPRLDEQDTGQGSVDGGQQVPTHCHWTGTLEVLLAP